MDPTAAGVALAHAVALPAAIFFSVHCLSAAAEYIGSAWIERRDAQTRELAATRARLDALEQRLASFETVEMRVKQLSIAKGLAFDE